MPSYVVTGASRGIGLEFIRQLSTNPDNLVIGLVRNVPDTLARLDDEDTTTSRRKNLHILPADLTSPSSLSKAAEALAKLLPSDSGLDNLIGNAALIAENTALKTLTSADPEVLLKDLDDSWTVNVVGNVHLVNTFLPLLRRSTNTKKKVVAIISSGMADLDLINTSKVAYGAPYSMSKAALNVAVAKYNAELADQGFLFMAISPGVVDTGNLSKIPQEDLPNLQDQMGKMAAYAPDWKGPITPEESVRRVLGVIEAASVERGDGGTFVSHFGNRQWL